MNPGRFFTPNFSTQFSPFIQSSYLPLGRNIGLFNKVANSIKRFNWGGLLNGANKTLNVVNQTIPLVRQAVPMVNNMKNMFKIAKVFGNETTAKKITNKTLDNVVSNKNNYENNNLGEQKKEVTNTNYPNFFI